MSMMLDVVLHTAVNPALQLLPRAMDTDSARVELLAIGAQESDYNFRFQKTADPFTLGPAAGFWQNERGTVNLVMTNPRTKDQAMAFITSLKVPFDSSLVWSALAHNDILAAGIARLILWADLKPLPPVDCTHEEAWECYVRNWRPGKPRRERWDPRHAAARAQVIS